MEMVNTLLSDPYLFFHYCDGIGPKRFTLINEAFGSAGKAFEASKKDWLKLGFPSKLVDTVFEYKSNFDLHSTKQELARFGIQYICREDDAFPRILKETADCPIGLFVKGHLLPQDAKSLAVVGTRKVTPYGREVTERFVAALVARGFTIVSGLARGVDGIAHKAAIVSGGRTIAVLGCGLDTVYPPEHRGLAAEVVDKGALISEFPPHTEIAPGNFPARNRIVSGISLGVLVTEGSIHSGTNITAMMAVEQNREVFAVPGPITSSMSQGPGKLIQMGAKLVLSIDDILSELDIALVQSNLNDGTCHTVPQVEFDDRDQEHIWKLLLEGQRHIDELGRELKLAVPLLSTSLTLMEMKGQVKHLGDGMWIAV